MNETGVRTIEDIKEFLNGTRLVSLEINGKDEKYSFIEESLIKFRYLMSNKKAKGYIFQYIQKITGYSRQQLSRLIAQYRKKGVIVRQKQKKNSFNRLYSTEDILLLIKTDNLHERLSGPVTKKILEREFLVYGKSEYSNICNISISHIYNLRQNKIYAQKALHIEKTKSVNIDIGERTKPQPYGEPGYIRVDTVHQGDLNKKKGVYHINSVDEVVQFEILAAVEGISDRYMVPILEAMIEQYPFVIKGFHSDNGSEYINFKVAAVLNRLLIKQTKSRSRHCNDNALAESKNASIVRKNMGYAHIPQEYADKINIFYKNYLNEHINYHRPCFFPEVYTDKKGKQRKKYAYKNIKTPYEKLKSLPRANSFLKPGITFNDLDIIAYRMSDNDAALARNKARDELFAEIDC